MNSWWRVIVSLRGSSTCGLTFLPWWVFSSFLPQSRGSSWNRWSITSLKFCKLSGPFSKTSQLLFLEREKAVDEWTRWWRREVLWLQSEIQTCRGYRGELKGRAWAHRRWYRGLSRPPPDKIGPPTHTNLVFLSWCNLIISLRAGMEMENKPTPANTCDCFWWWLSDWLLWHPETAEPIRNHGATLSGATWIKSEVCKHD